MSLWLIFLQKSLFVLPTMLPNVVKPGGYFITAGIIQQKKDEVKESIESAGFEIEETVKWKIGYLLLQKENKTNVRVLCHDTALFIHLLNF